MEIRFLLDPDTGLPHCDAHGVEAHEVFEVFSNGPLRLHAQDGSYMALGQTDAGRYLKVIHLLEEGGVFVITAYDLRGKALAAFKRRRRGRGKR